MNYLYLLITILVIFLVASILIFNAKTNIPAETTSPTTKTYPSPTATIYPFPTSTTNPSPIATTYPSPTATFNPNIGMQTTINFDPDSLSTPANYNTLKDTYMTTDITPTFNKIHCGEKCKHTPDSKIGWEYPERLRGYRYRTDLPCEKLSFEQRTFVHVNTKNPLYIQTPFGPGKYEITINTGDCANLNQSYPRLQLTQTNGTFDLISDKDSNVVDNKVASIKKEVNITDPSFYLLDPRSPVENADKGTVNEAVSIPNVGDVIQPTRISSINLRRIS